MRRTVFAVLLFGLLIAWITAGPAAADNGPCGKDFPARLECWQGALDDGALVTVTLNEPLDFEAGHQIPRDLKNLQVRVPAGVHTGQGGTALLILAGHRLVARDASIDGLSQGTLNALGDCNAVCGQLRKSLTGAQLIGKDVGVADLDTHTFTVGEHKSSDYLLLLLIALTAVLFLLLLGLLLAVRRSRAPALAAAGAAGAAEVGPEVRSEETTARLRPVPPAPAPPPSPGRRVGPRTGPSRTALVRTALRPQGYVELDQVLYRAVWAEPDRTPPDPGGQVEVTDAHEPDSDVLYAYPPAARHHARGGS
ncbi:hypothetical protein ACIRU8_12935 [Streptomyces sp. NPDC101175]|uniref:hypothetical protein n=1 Tax=Streptomyces sp. NPDC101175 TaxID=3366123 RepID=UPI0038355D21